MDLKLPGENEPEKYAMYLLGLSFFPRCPGADACQESRKCFECHSLEFSEGKGEIRSRYKPMWKHYKSFLQVKRQSAQERLLSGFALPYARRGRLREWFPGMEQSASEQHLLPDFEAVRDDEQELAVPELHQQAEAGAVESEEQARSRIKLAVARGQAYFLMWCWGRLFCGRSVAFADLPRIHERICWFLDFPVGFHYAQLTPIEHMAIVQEVWLERLCLHHSTRQVSSSQRRAERFAYIAKEDNGDDLEVGGMSIDYGLCFFDLTRRIRRIVMRATFRTMMALHRLKARTWAMTSSRRTLLTGRSTQWPEMT